MCAEALPSPAAGVRSPWTTTLVVTLVGALFLIGIGRRQYVEPFFCICLGVALLRWGRQAVRAYALLGAAMVSVGLMAFVLQAPAAGAVPSAAGLLLIDLVVLAGALPVAVRVNRRYLWEAVD